MRFLCKSKRCDSFEFFGTDDIGDCAKELRANWDDFISCEEREYADVGGGGRFFDCTEKVCIEFLNQYERDPKQFPLEWDWEELVVPNLVKLHCAERIAEIEGEAADYNDWMKEENSNYYRSLGVGRAWR